jgi:hypothetical protein
MQIARIAGAVAAGTVVFSFGSVTQASAADSQVFGLQQTINDPNGGQIGYTVTKFFPSADAIPYPVSGQLYEVTVRADALNGIVAPAIPAFSAQAGGGQSYPALAGVWAPQALSGAALLPGGRSTGKIYFDAVGEPPTSVVFNGAGDTLTWIEPPAAPVEEEAAPEEEAPAEEAPAEEAAPEEAAPEGAAPEEAAPEGEAAEVPDANADVAVEEE